MMEVTLEDWLSNDARITNYPCEKNRSLPHTISPKSIPDILLVLGIDLNVKNKTLNF